MAELRGRRMLEVSQLPGTETFAPGIPEQPRRISEVYLCAECGAVLARDVPLGLLTDSARRCPACDAPSDLASRTTTACRRRTVAVMVPLLLLLGLLLSLLPSAGAFRWAPNGSSFGADFAMFFGAAQVARDGGNPYDAAAVHHAEFQLFQREGLPLTNQRYVRVANPPLLYWALQPLTQLPWRVVSYLWIISMCLLSVLGFVAALRSLHWRRWLLPCLMFVAMPQVVFGAYYGNVNGAVFAAIGCSLLLLHRWPAAAGAVLSLVWLKPHVGIPVVMLLALFHSRVRRRMLAGFCAATGLMLGLTVAVTGFHRLGQWGGAMEGFAHSAGTYSDVVSLSTLWSGTPSVLTRLLLQVAVAGAAGGLTALCWWKHRRSEHVPLLSWAWLWPVWLLAAPFGHFHDEILLAIPLLALLGRDARQLLRPPSVAALYLSVLSLVFFSVPSFHARLNWVGLVGLAVCLFVAARSTRGTKVPRPIGPLSFSRGTSVP